MIKCGKCGTENPKNAKFCANCGEQLSVGAVETEKKPTRKHLQANFLYVFIVVLLIIGAVNLYFGGVFDSLPDAPETSVGDNSSATANPHAGVDMSQLRKIMDLEKKVDANPDDLTSLLELAHLLNDSGFKEKAIQRYGQYLKSRPEDADVWVDMGVCYYQLKNYDDAEKSMKKGIEINPNHQIAYFNLGIIYYAVNRTAEAKENFKKAFELNPNTRTGRRAKELLNN